MQATQAPFVLDFLGCTGTETRLVDCPIDTDSQPQAYEDTGIFFSSDNGDACDPFGFTYVYVACGTLSGPGTTHCT